MRLSDPELTGSTRAWHGAYCRWYDHRADGHSRRAAVWGWVADRLARVA
jgi:hypothetical protein